MNALTLILLAIGALQSVERPDADIRLQVEMLNDKLSVMLINDSSVSYVVDKDFGIEPLFGEISIIIKDEGALFPLTAMPRATKPVDANYVTLHPGQFVGNYIPFWLIKAMYSLKKQCYDIHVVYEYKWELNEEAFVGPVESNTVRACFQ